MRALRILVASCALLLAAFGCGLIDTSFTFATDPQSFTLDTAALGLTVPGGTKIPAIPCTDSSVCGAASAQLACQGGSYGCKLECKASSCAVTATAEFAVPVDVSSKIKNNTQAAVLSKVSLQKLVMTVKQNSLNFATPGIDVFVGPGSASKTTDAGVVKLGTIPAIAPGSTQPLDIPTTEEGKARIAEYVKNYTQPFKMLARTSLTFSSGAPVPQGRLAFDVIAHLQVEP
jgi:hypothetical protein